MTRGAHKPETQTAPLAAFDLRQLVQRVSELRESAPSSRSVLIALTGIDGCGKGYITARLAAALEAAQLRTASINVDGWLNLPAGRFSTTAPAGHFYAHAIRFDALFAELVMPLREHRAVGIEADFVTETATEYCRRRYEFSDVDVILLEGIYLLKRAFQTRYDLSIWIDCRFETALARAVARAQEGLPPAATIRAYERIYFPAQRIHFRRDAPKAAATLVVVNDTAPEPRAR